MQPGSTGEPQLTPDQHVALARELDDAEKCQWPAAGFADTEIGCFMKPEVAYAAKTVRA